MRALGAGFLMVAVLFLYSGNASAAEAGVGAMRLSSPEFENNGLMPSKCTCDAQNINPALLIRGVPSSARTLVLIVDGPDAPVGIWVHWVVFNIPVTRQIEESSVPGIQGLNSFGRRDYGGPCPPSGTHRYFFKLYALDAKLSLSAKVSKEDLERTMQGHILDTAELVGLYKRR